MKALLKTVDLTKIFPIRQADGSVGELLAVDQVSISMMAKGSLAIVGESGSGKTTVARIIAGMMSPTSGHVEIDGKVRSSLRLSYHERKRRARQVQMVFQDPYSSLDPHQTISGTIRELLREHFPEERASEKERIAELLEQVGLDARHADSRPRALSGGQRQRAAIARALAVKPSLLILDEAVAALDVSVQAQVLNLLADLRDSLHVSYLFISHDLGVVRQVSDECVVMHRGKIVETGSTSEVLDNPQDPYTRRLLAALPRSGWKPKRQARVKLVS